MKVGRRIRGLALAGVAAMVGVLMAPTGAMADHPNHPTAGDPGRWVQVGASSVPLYDYQGVTSDAQRNFYFDGVYFGLYRTTNELVETGRNDTVIPPQVQAAERYNHIGDVTLDGREGGRVLLPLECYYPVPGSNGNPCASGSIGVADPCTLTWRYYVRLDPADIQKVMWNEVSPDGELVWTQSGDGKGGAGKDLLAYRAADISPQNAAPGSTVIKPVRRLVGAVPSSGITGAAFLGETLYVAGQNTGPFRVYSVDLETGRRTLEIEHAIVGESEGLDTLDARGGVLHWLIQPFNTKALPTYGVANGTLLHFLPSGATAPAAKPSSAPVCGASQPPPAPGTPPPPPGTQPPPPPPGTQPPPPSPAPSRESTPPPALGAASPGSKGRRLRISVTPRATRAGALTRFRFRVTAFYGRKRRAIRGARINFAGRVARTDRHGRRSMRVRFRAPGAYRAVASRRGMRTGYSVFVRVSR